MEAAQTWTVARLLTWTREYFEQRGLESARLCAEILLADALGCQRIELYTRHEMAPDAAILQRYRGHVRAAADGTPIAYLIGYKEFFSLRFKVTDAVLIPRPETELLVEKVTYLARGSEPIQRILDVGTGSGCIAIALATQLPEARIAASDLSPAALAIAAENAAAHGVADRIEFRAGDLLAPWQDDGPFDVLVSNPPYVATRDADDLPRSVREHEPHQALFAGDDGLDVVRPLIERAGSLLRPGGHLLVEIAYDQGPRTRALLEQAGWHEVVGYKDLARHERVVHARRGPAEDSQVA